MYSEELIFSTLLERIFLSTPTEDFPHTLRNPVDIWGRNVRYLTISLEAEKEHLHCFEKAQKNI